MKPRFRLFLLGFGLTAVAQAAALLPGAGLAQAEPVPPAPPPAAQSEPNSADLSARLADIIALRTRWLLTAESPPQLDSEYDLSINSGRWALAHEKARIRYLRQWAENRGVEFVSADPQIRMKYLGSKQPDRARFYVTQSLGLTYRYVGETTPNQFGVGTRHIVELRKKGDRWLIGLEWYSDPLGEEGETPDVSPALAPLEALLLRTLAPLPPTARRDSLPAAGGGYNRDGAVVYADTYCGLALGCGNDRRYNPRYRDYNGVGGDCTHFASQALRVGGGLRVGYHLQASDLAGALEGAGRGSVTIRAPFREIWRIAKAQSNGFPALVRPGDLVFYQEKGELKHAAIVTGFDSRGYPLVNSHTVDRYHVPFDLGWDRRTSFWFLRIWG